MQLLKPGLTAKATLVVNDTHTARRMGSGAVDVLATPIMVALMEEAARKSVDPHLEQSNELSVGIALDITHKAATPVGMSVWAEAELLKVEGRKLTFGVKAGDELEIIGEGVHTRAIVNRDRFLDQARKKADNRL
jgi:predicted thioesterase